MPVTVTFRLNEADQAHEVSLDELKARIASGEIGPKSLMYDRVLTDGEWRTLDNLNIFHSHSPVSHEVGSHLKEKRRSEEEKKYAEKIRANWTQKVLASLPQTFVDDCLGFESFDKILSKRETIGILRLIRCPAFGGIDGVTIIFGELEATVLMATAARNPKHALTAPVIEWVNSEIPDWNLLAMNFSANEVRKTRKNLGFQAFLPPLNNWPDAKAAIQLAPDCNTETLDGYTFVHSSADREWKTMSTWSNPRFDSTPVQARLVEAYKPFLHSFI